MAYINSVTIMGEVQYEPELRQTSNGKPVCSLTVMTAEKRGSSEFKTYHKVSVWGEYANRCKNELRVGDGVVTQGSLKTDSWEDKVTKKKMYQTKIDTFHVGFMRRKLNVENVEPQPQVDQYNEPPTHDDIPF